MAWPKRKRKIGSVLIALMQVVWRWEAIPDFFFQELVSLRRKKMKAVVSIFLLEKSALSDIMSPLILGGKGNRRMGK